MSDNKTVVEESQIVANEPQGVWNLAKLNKAKRLLEKGHTVAQVGSQLRLSVAQIEELQVDVEAEATAIQIEPYADWRKRQNENIERKLVGIVDKHLDAVAEDSSLLDPETMGTVKNAAQIAHLWLRKGEEGGKAHVTVNINALANAQGALGSGTGKVLDVESSEVQDEQDGRATE